MRRFISVSVIILAVFTNTLFSYNWDEESEGNYTLGVGLQIGYKMGVNAADPPQGIKNDLGLAGIPDFGVTVYIPFDKRSKMGLVADAMYANYAFGLKMYDDPNNKWTNRLNYLTLGGHFYLSGFTLGLVIGLPTGGEAVYESRTDEIKSDQLATMYALKIGANIPVYYDDIGRLNLVAQLGYFLSGLYSDGFGPRANNPHPASLMLGISYMFNMPDNY